MLLSSIYCLDIKTLSGKNRLLISRLMRCFLARTNLSSDKHQVSSRFMLLTTPPPRVTLSHLFYDLIAFFVLFIWTFFDFELLAANDELFSVVVRLVLWPICTSLR